MITKGITKMSDVVQAIIVGISVSFFSSVLFFIFQTLINRRNVKRIKADVDIKNIKAGLQAELMSDLEEKGESFIRRGYATTRDKEIYDKLYKAYHELGNNGVMTSMYEKVMALPLEKVKKYPAHKQQYKEA